MAKYSAIIPHVLEGTDLYDAMQNAVFAYAKSKGEYESRLKDITALYEGVDADPVKELTADLIGDYLFTDAEFVNSLAVNNRNLFQKVYDEIKYLCRVVTAGSKEARQLEKVRKTFADAYRNTQAKTNTADDGGVRCLNIKHTDGSVEVLADARSLTAEQAVDYLYQAKAGKLRGDTYIPVRKDTPQVIIDTLEQVNEIVDNCSMVMKVKKAVDSMKDEVTRRAKKYGNNVRKHGLTPEQIVSIISNLDDPSTIIYETNRYDDKGNKLPNAAAVFVSFTSDGREGLAVVEFENPRKTDAIGLEYGDTNYHTVVTVFEPDIERNGVVYDHIEDLLSDPNNYELEIKRRQPEGSATQANQPNTSKGLPSNKTVPQESSSVNGKLP